MKVVIYGPKWESHYFSIDHANLSPVVQSVIGLTSSLRVISLTVLADSIYNILIFFCWKNVKATHIFFSKKFHHICVSLDVNFNESLTNNVVSFAQLGPEHFRNLMRIVTVFIQCKVNLHVKTKVQSTTSNWPISFIAIAAQPCRLDRISILAI